jgi:hypothetical protein
VRRAGRDQYEAGEPILPVDGAQRRELPAEAVADHEQGSTPEASGERVEQRRQILLDDFTIAEAGAATCTGVAFPLAAQVRHGDGSSESLRQRLRERPVVAGGQTHRRQAQAHGCGRPGTLTDDRVRWHTFRHR